MKLQKSDIKKLLCDTHIHELTEEQIKHLGIICSLTVTKYKKSEHGTTFFVSNQNRQVRVEIESRVRYISLKKINSKMGQCWGGQYTFANLFSILRAYYYKEMELVMKTNDYPEYTGEEFAELFEEALEYIN